MPEYAFGIMLTALLGWGSFTWRRAEDALTRAIAAGDRVDRLEVKMAENYLTKVEFQNYTDRLFDTLGEMKTGQQYLVKRIDYHVLEQAGESKQLRSKLDKQIEINDQLKESLED